MRILHIYSGNLFGGIEAILISLARHASLGADRHEFALCFDARLADSLRAACAPVHLLAPVRVRRPHTVRQARRRLTSLLASHAFDVCLVHAPWSHALFGGTVHGAGVPLVFWAHDAWSGQHWTERWARRTPPDAIVANSAFTLGTLDNVYRGVARSVVHAPLDVRPVTVDTRERAVIRAELSTPDTAIVVAQASRMEAWKGHATLLRALAALRHDVRWICWIVGSAQRPAEQAYERSLRELATELGILDRVRFAGERHDVPRVLAAADVYCQPNARPEPFGIVFIEALTAGIPVLTAAVGGALDIVDDTCGRLAAAADGDAWRSTLSALIADERERTRLGAAGPARAATLCDPARQIQRLHAVLGATTHVGVAG
ncbi:MAG TPA: glycosyltransferase family 4 protein [Caldimonas sp.]|nr:glycosyltransferase family 4 protein [Caldimonas sp.]